MHRARAGRDRVVATLAGGVMLLCLLSFGGSAPATAAPAETAAAQAAAGAHGAVNRFNVGAAHSPQVESMLAGGAASHAAATRSSAASVPAGASTVQGIDVASVQHPNGAAITWSDVAAAGYQFAFIKVSEGSYYVNPYYAGDATGAESAGMFTAPYVFAIPNYSGGALQADYALDHMNYPPNGKTLPLIVDLEFDPYDGQDGTPSGSECYGLSPAQMVSWIHSFVTEAQRRTGQAPIIYTVYDWWDTCTGDSTAFSADPLWEAAPGSTAPTTTNGLMPAGWSTWTYWQYSSTQTVSGISGDVDTSYLSSSALELAAPASQSDQTGSTPASLTLSALGGATVPSYTATGMPAGLSLSSAGVTSGTLSGPVGSNGVTVTATDGTLTATQSFTWDVHRGAKIGAVKSQTGSVGSPVRLQVPVTDGLPGCTLRLSATGLPRGLTMNSCGLIYGWPSISGEYKTTVKATDSSGATLAQGSFSWKLTRASGRGPAGRIRLRRDGKCLAEFSATDIATENCGSASSQRWTIAADGSVRVNGRCLAAKSAAASASAALELTSCSTGGQRWQVLSNAGLKNLTDSKCLNDTGTKNGSRATAAPCKFSYNATGSAATPSSSQQWTLPAGALTSGMAGWCASDLRNSGQPSGAVTLRRCNGTSQQNWTVEPNGSLVVGGKCMGLAGGATTPGTQVRLVSCSGTGAQVWQLSGGPIGVQALSPVAGLCLADPSDRTVAGTLLVIDPCVAADPGTSWRVS